MSRRAGTLIKLWWFVLQPAEFAKIHDETVGAMVGWSHGHAILNRKTMKFNREAGVQRARTCVAG